MSSLGIKELFELRLKGLPLPPMDERDCRRVFCSLCCDDGFVRIWHRKTVEAVGMIHREGSEWTGNGGCYDAIAACTCRRGDAWHDRGTQQKPYIFLPRYDPQKHCRLHTSVADSADRARLIEWIENYRPANYERAFDEFNARAYQQTEFD